MVYLRTSKNTQDSNVRVTGLTLRFGHYKETNSLPLYFVIPRSLTGMYGNVWGLCIHMLDATIRCSGFVGISFESFLSMVCLVQSTFLMISARPCHKSLTEDAHFRIWFKDKFAGFCRNIR